MSKYHNRKTTLPTGEAFDSKREALRECAYVADFTYTDTRTGEHIVEDVKGHRTPEYIIKKKLMLHLYGIEVTET